MFVAGFAGYLLYFFPMWEPFTALKIFLLGLMVLGTGYALDVLELHAPRPRRQRRRAYTPGERSAEARKRWPRGRGAVAMATGVLFLVMGSWQGLRSNFGVGGSVVLSYLCFLVSGAFGGTLYMIGLGAQRLSDRALRYVGLAGMVAGFGIAAAGRLVTKYVPPTPDPYDSGLIGWLYTGGLIALWGAYMIWRHRGTRSTSGPYSKTFE